MVGLGQREYMYYVTQVLTLYSSSYSLLVNKFLKHGYIVRFTGVTRDRLIDSFSIYDVVSTIPAGNFFHQGLDRLEEIT